MKFLFVLLALTPLVYCATLTHEEQLIIQAMTETQKRVIVNGPNIHDIRVAICKVMDNDAALHSCSAACPIALDLFPYGRLALPLCGYACSGFHC